MRKFLSIILLSLCCVAVSAIDLCKNLSITGDIYFKSKEIWRGAVLAGDGASADLSLTYGNDACGHLSASGWLTVNQSKYFPFYREADAQLSYAVPGDYFAVDVLYCGYMGLYEAPEDNSDAYFGFQLSGGESFPLQLSYTVQFYGSNKGSMLTALQYTAEVNSFTFVPLVGWHIIDIEQQDSYAYLQLECSYDYPLAEWCGLDFVVGAAVNFADVNHFSYGDNANVWVGIGWYFE